jgi:photosystem II stability/assembly factor-like uncharacterized protein
VHDDVQVERVFVNPLDPRVVLVTASEPRSGVFSTSDGGLTWSFAGLDEDDEGGPAAIDGSTPRLFREVLFDEANHRRVFALQEKKLLRSEDGGASWTVCPLGAPDQAVGPIDTAAVAGASLLVASGRYLYSSEDAGRSFVRQPIRVEGVEEDNRVRVRSIAVDANDPRRVLLSLHAVENGIDPAGRIAATLSGTSDLGLAAQALVDAQDPRPQPFSLGSGPSGVLVSTDGGIEWRRSSLGLDAWLVARAGVVYALAAAPVLEAATLAREQPALAEAVQQQMHGLRIDVSTIRAAFEFPGRERLLLGPLATAPLFRSIDGGFTWARVFAKEAAGVLALRAPIERQRAAWLDLPVGRPRSEAARPRGGGGGGRMGGRGRGGGGRRGGAAPSPRPAQQRARPSSSEAILAYLDPVRLLSRYNADRPLSGVAAAGSRALLAFVPSEAQWSRLAGEALSSSDVAGEISLGPGYPPKDPPPRQPFELLRSADGGADWEPAGPSASDFAVSPENGRRPVPYPESIASSEGEVIVVFDWFDKDRRALRTGWRWLESNQGDRGWSARPESARQK